MTKKYNYIITVVTLVALVLTSFLISLKFVFDNEFYSSKESEYVTVRLDHFGTWSWNTKYGLVQESNIDGVYVQEYFIIESTGSTSYFKARKGVETRITLYMYNCTVFVGLAGSKPALGTSVLLSVHNVAVNDDSVKDTDSHKKSKLSMHDYSAVFEADEDRWSTLSYTVEIVFTPTEDMMYIGFVNRTYVYDDIYRYEADKPLFNFYDGIKL